MINITKPIIEKEEIDAVNKVLNSGMIAQGPKTSELEERFATYCGTKYAVAFNSGTAAIHAALYALGIKDGDEVITTPFTFVATANPILMQGAKVVFADICEDDFCIDPIDVAKKITPKTKAIIPVDLYGQIYNTEEITKIAKKHHLKIVEDACQAVGAEVKSIKTGNFGDIAAFSLYATKNIQSAEGGLVTTNNEEYYEKCKMLRHHGQSEKVRYEYLDLGYNYRTTDICAAIGVEQLKKIDIITDARIRNAKRLSEGLGGIKGLILPQTKDSHKHVFHQYTIRINPDFKSSRDEFLEYLREQEIGAGVYYPKPLHLHQHFQKMGYKAGDFPVAERVASEVISLPVHPLLLDNELEYIIKKVRDYVK